VVEGRKEVTLPFPPLPLPYIFSVILKVIEGRKWLKEEKKEGRK
jgi:hypothetical protein